MSRLTLSDLPGTDAASTSRSAQGRQRRRRQRRSRALVVGLVCLGVVGAGVGFVSEPLREAYTELTAPDDYEGSGSGEVQVRIDEGASGREIGQELEAAGVVMTEGAFVTAITEEPRAASIQPGSYALRSEMAAASALEMLLDPESLQSYAVTIPEGFTVPQVLERVAEATGSSPKDLQAAVGDPAIGLPPEAGGQLEGYLFPATYEFDLEVTDVEVLAEMVGRTQAALDELAVPADQRYRVLTVASLIQAEAGTSEDMGRVSQVISNRLGIMMPLQFDSTVNYATGKTRLTTTPEDRDTDSPYNTYLYPGLPAGPISNPGDEALAAALAPTPGDWLYFVVVDPDSGVSQFAATKAEHDANVQQFRAWLRENPQG